MSQLSHNHPTTPPVRAMSWLDTWKTALNQPDATTYRMIANDPRASLKRVVVWMVGGSLIGTSISIVVGYLLNSAERPVVPASQLPVALTLTVAIVSLVNVAAFGAAFVVMHLLARWMGSKTTFLQLAYISAAFSAPLIVASGIVGFIEYVGLLITVAWIRFQFKALTSVNQLSRGKAILVLVAGTAIQLIILLPIWLV